MKTTKLNEDLRIQTTAVVEILHLLPLSAVRDEATDDEDRSVSVPLAGGNCVRCYVIGRLIRGNNHSSTVSKLFCTSVSGLLTG